MFTTKFISTDFNNAQKALYEHSFEDMMRFDSALFSPMIPQVNEYMTLPMEPKNVQLHNSFGLEQLRCSAGEKEMILSDMRPSGCMEPGQSPINLYDFAPFTPIEDSDILNNMCDAFVCGGLDSLMAVAPQTNNFLKNTFFTDLPSTVISGYNHGLELPVGFDEQQPYFNSGATTSSSLMCCATHNIVLPESSVSHLPDLAAPDEFVSSDEDGSSAVDDHDYPICKDGMHPKDEQREINLVKEDVTTESDHRQVEHDKKHQQILMKPGRKKLANKTDEEYTRKCKVGYHKKRNGTQNSKPYHKKPCSLYGDQSDNGKRTRKNYEKDVINVLMSWYLEHDGKIPDSSAKADLGKATGKSLVQISTWFQNARRRYARKLEDYRLYSKKYPDSVYDSETLEAFLRSKQP